jgi:hypothetical protein
MSEEVVNELDNHECWTVQNDEGLTIKIYGEDSQEIRKMVSLIKAAPDILKTLKLVKEMISPEIWDQLPAFVAGGYDQVNQVADAIDTSIKKAEVIQ